MFFRQFRSEMAFAGAISKGWPAPSSGENEHRSVVRETENSHCEV